MYVAAVVPVRGLTVQWLTESTGQLLVLLIGLAGVGALAWRLRLALEVETQLQHEALTDPLTLLPNRRALDADAAQALALADRSGGPFAVVMADIDFFKAINDTFGHDTGDTVLATFAQRLGSALRMQDRAYRFGGEEFCVLLPATNAAGACQVAERLRLATAQSASDQMHAVTASFGVAVWKLGDDVRSLIERADAALYRAKAAGRNRVEPSYLYQVAAAPLAGPRDGKGPEPQLT
jgi:diguanylate cyclase (GGDEF)-like protein